MKLSDFIKVVERGFVIPKEAIYERNREVDVVLARCVVWYVMKDLGMAYNAIARKFRMTPASVIHGIKLVEKKRGDNKIISDCLTKAEKEGVEVC